MASSAPASRSQQAAPLPSSSTTAPATGLGTAPPEKSYFETQRAALIGEIAISMEHVLSNINKLNRSLEGVIAVGNEFGSVEALWSQFENVMARDTTSAVVGADGGADGAGGGASGAGSEKGHGHDDEDD